MFACLNDEGAGAGAALAAFAGEWAPRVETIRPGLVVLDAGGLARLFGSPTAWATQMVAAARTRGWRVRAAVAGTRVAAVLLALSRPGLTVVSPGREAEALAPLPLGLLVVLDGAGLADSAEPPPVPAPAAATRRAGEARLDTLARWGLQTLGDLAALPAAEVAARLGDAGRRWHARARGQDPRPLVSDREDAPCEATLDLEWPIEGLEPLSFVLARVLDPLCATLQREERGAAVIHTQLDLVTRTPHRRTLQIPAPINDARALRTLILLDLERHPPEAGIDRVTVRLEPAPGPRVQFSLFRRPLPAPDQVASLMARLNALMGEGRCGSPVLLDTHRPGVFALAPFVPGAGHEKRRDSRPDPGQPHAVLRRFRKPVPARVALRDGQPVRVISGAPGLGGGAVVACAGPWRTSGGWWRAHHPAGSWNRDEWDLALASGGVYRLSRVRADDRWVIEGIWD